MPGLAGEEVAEVDDALELGEVEAADVLPEGVGKYSAGTLTEVAEPVGKGSAGTVTEVAGSAGEAADDVPGLGAGEDCVGPLVVVGEPGRVAGSEALGLAGDGTW